MGAGTSCIGNNPEAGGGQLPCENKNVCFSKNPQEAEALAATARRLHLELEKCLLLTRVLNLIYRFKCHVATS